MNTKKSQPKPSQPPIEDEDQLGLDPDEAYERDREDQLLGEGMYSDEWDDDGAI